MSNHGENIRRIAVFTEILPFSVRRGMAEVLREFPDIELLVLEQKKPRRASRVIKNQMRELRRNGPRWIPYQIGDVLGRIRSHVHGAPEQPADRPGGEYELAALQSHPRVRWMRVANLHADASIAALREFTPDVGLSLGAPILKPGVFDVPRLGTLNLHKGKLPDFRGMPPAFWELQEGVQEFGCTLHKIDAGLDTGPILLERALPRLPHATLRGAQIALDEVGIEMTNEGLRRLRQGRAEYLPQRSGGRLHKKPTLAQRAELARRLRPKTEDPPLRSAAKSTAFFGYVHGLRRLRRAPELVILLYHRVSDELRDRVTIGLGQFEEQMELLARHYTLVSLADVAHGKLPRSPRPLVAVTFDDGYLDNYLNAVPILLQARVPATFFVSTGHIGSERPFAHDLKKVGRGLPTMTWDQLRTMRAHGFGIGSHTVHHVDCARAEPALLRRELEESRDTLRKELGLDEVLFAYPFGRRENMTPEALEVVKQVGYACCCSAYGGVNGRALDRFNLLRIGINWRITPLAFRARLAGLQWEGRRPGASSGAEPRVAHQEGGM